MLIRRRHRNPRLYERDHYPSAAAFVAAAARVCAGCPVTTQCRDAADTGHNVTEFVTELADATGAAPVVEPIDWVDTSVVIRGGVAYGRWEPSTTEQRETA